MNKDEFIKKSIDVHGNTYSYDLIPVKVVSTDKVTIICSKHGEFVQRVPRHLNGQKCKKCSLESRTKTREEFIDKSNKVHGAFYNYDKIKSEFVKRADKVDIICPENINIGYGTPDMPNLNIGTKIDFRKPIYS